MAHPSVTTSRSDKTHVQIYAAVDHNQGRDETKGAENGDLLERIGLTCDTKCAGQHIGNGGHNEFPLIGERKSSATLPETTARRLQDSLFSAYGLLYFYLATFSFGHAGIKAGFSGEEFCNCFIFSTITCSIRIGANYARTPRPLPWNRRPSTFCFIWSVTATMSSAGTK
jgi:hypothetical protein